MITRKEAPRSTKYTRRLKKKEKKEAAMKLSHVFGTLAQLGISVQLTRRIQDYSIWVCTAFIHAEQLFSFPSNGGQRAVLLPFGGDYDETEFPGL